MQDEESGKVVKMSDYRSEERRKQILWVDGVRKDIRKLSAALREAIGHQLWLVQSGLMPSDYKYMGDVGDGVYEIRACDELGKNVGRCFYVTKLGDEIAVLHVFIKKTAKTSQSDIRIGQERYKSLVKQLKQKQKST